MLEIFLLRFSFFGKLLIWGIGKGSLAAKNDNVYINSERRVAEFILDEAMQGIVSNFFSCLKNKECLYCSC